MIGQAFSTKKIEPFSQRKFGRGSLVLDRHWQGLDTKLAKLWGRAEQNLWTEDSRIAFSQILEK